MIADAKALADAGAHMLVLEMVPTELANRVTDAVDIPTIGIGAGPGTDGQVLVIYDLLGMNTDFKPKFLKHYATLESTMVEAHKAYSDEVNSGEFPTEEHSF